MTTTAITPQLKITMLKHLVAGRDLDFVATVTSVPRDTVLDIVSNHGYPDHDRMGWAIDMIIQGGDKIPARPVDNRPRVLLDEPAAERRPQTMNHAQSTGQRPAPRNPGYALTPPPPTRPAHTSISELLHQAGESNLTRTRALGSKISALVADLTQRLADEQGALEAKNKAARESAAVAARIAVLQAEIDKLKGSSKRAKTAVASPRKYTQNRGVHPCTNPDCDRTFDTPQGAVTHRRRAHEGFNPVTKAGAA
jgi:hypothetical protein